MFEIVTLDINEYRGMTLEFIYKTRHYLDIESFNNIDGRIFKLARKNYLLEMDKNFSTTIGKDFLNKPILVGAKSGEEIRGYLEVSFEDWNNRMRITNIMVLPPYRNQGIGAALIKEAINIAKNHGCRAIVLETQSCNTPAMGFYASHGFDIIGFDLTHYGNDDVQNKSFRIEMGISL